MSKIDARLLKKIIREMIEEETNSSKLHPHELEKLDSLFESQEMNEAFGSKLKKGLATLGLGAALAGGMGSKAQAADYDPVKAAGGETRSWQQVVGTGERPEAKKGKFVIVNILDTKTNKEIPVSFDNDGRPLHQIENEAINYLNNKPGNTGRFTVSKESQITDTDTTILGKGGGAKPEVKKSAAEVVSVSDDGKTVTVKGGSGGDAASAAGQYMLKATGKNHKTGEVKQDSNKNWTVPVTAVNESRVNKNLLTKLIIEHLEECGMMPQEQSEEGELPAEVSSIEIDPDGYEGYMAKGNLYKMGKSATELHNMIADQENLEPWVEEKIAVAARMIDDVADYMEYAKKSKQ